PSRKQVGEKHVRSRLAASAPVRDAAGRLLSPSTERAGIAGRTAGKETHSMANILSWFRGRPPALHAYRPAVVSQCVRATRMSSYIAANALLIHEQPALRARDLVCR